jgi:hypothetical protein
LLGRSIRPVLCVNPFPYDSGNEYDDQLKEENVHGGLILQGFVHLGALPSSNPQFEGMHQELRGIRAIDTDCNRRLHLERISGQLAQEERAAISRRVPKMADEAPLIRPYGLPTDVRRSHPC